MKKYTLLLSILFLIHVTITAQIKNEGVLYIKNYTLKQYQGSPQNWAIVQDHRGVMYIGNNYGLLEFDGSHWRRIGLPNRSVVRSLAVSKAGKVFVGGQNDFGYLQADSQGIINFVSLKGAIEKEHQDFADVWNIYSNDETIYFCTVSGVYQYENGKIKVFKVPYEPTGFPLYVHGRLFVPVPNVGLFELKDEKLIHLPGSDKITSYNITAMLPYPEGKILIFTEDNGSFFYDGFGDFTSTNWTINNFLSKSKVYTATALSEGYAIGTILNGLLIIDTDGNPRQHINQDKGLQNSTVRSIYQDQKGNLWLALNNGVDYIEANSPFSLFNAKLGLPGTAYTSLLDNSRLYLGTSDGLFYKTILEQENPLKPTPLQSVENSEGQVYNLQKIAGKLLLSHHNGPFEIINNKAIKLSDHRGAWMFLPLKSHPGYVVCGTYYGLLLYKLVNGQLEFQRKLQGFDESSRIMEEDSEGNIWVAHGYVGLFKIKLADNLGKVEKVSFYNQKHGFPSDFGINVFKINGKLIFTGLYGVYTYNRATDRFDVYDELNNLFEGKQQVRKLFEDKKGNIWFSAGEEMGFIRKRNNGSYDIVKNVFNKLEGRLIGGFEHIAYYNNENVLIGIDEGFVHYRPISRQQNVPQQEFNTLIRKVEVRSQTADSLVYGGTSLKNNEEYQQVTSILTLPYSLNSLKFTFGAILYDDIEGVQYQYYLEGFDQNWSPWVKVLQKEYTNLREGTYTFHVKSRNVYNQESKTATYTFIISPPWYRSILAYVVYFLLGITLLFLLKRIIEKHIRQAEKRLQLEQEKAIKLKEAQHMEEVLKAEKEIIRLNNEKLENELNHKSKELTSSALHVMQNMDAVHKVKDQLQQVMDQVPDKDTRQQLRKVLRSVEEEIKIENNWEQFELHFNQVHQDFLKRLSNDFPELTHKDLRLCAYLRLNLSSKEIASLLKLSLRGVETSRYRIRKKMNLDQDVNLTESILKY